ncbi:tRNA (adenosine(37)-N6)-threonylcarbamoyltransferase complex dimerization subunit type 1 TsaB [Caulobacter sp. S45]|uniref:tRNA (adenosine(37)-N6)-threonylcarbamoyltransferase complex dimerization subunit type 1 TsaB n=1 Tax=Caulobacter sp. S45 TaxID=1641861 RepID=UPI003530499E
MIVLALDTALDACSVAVVADGQPLAVRTEAMERGHQERLAPMVAEAMQAAGVAFAALDRIAVTVGPGSFTGLRVGLAFAKAMSLALGIPCLGVGTLEALAASAPGRKDAPLLVAALDARRDQLYLQAFSRARPLGDPENLPLEAAVERLAGMGADESTPVVGSGAGLLGLGDRAQPTPDMIDPIALARLAAVRPKPDGRPAPMYLRAPDARTLAERARIAQT